MEKQGKLVSLNLCSGHRKPMLAVQSAQAIKGLGLKGDIHAIADSTRQVLLIEKETLDMLGLRRSMVRENITTEGIDLMSLKPKSRVKVGEATLEITQECKPCKRMDEVRLGLRSQLEGKRGMLARVIDGGKLTVGDPVIVLS